jgi:hypothetical protein
MKRPFFFGCLLTVIAGRTVIAQTPPPNDNFTNAILLSGDQVSFSGTLTNATIEGGEPYVTYNSPRSVWWKWVPAATGPVVVQISPGYPLGPGNDAKLEIFRGNNVSNLEYIDGMTLDTPAGPYLIHSLYVPTNSYYYFRASGSWQGSFNVQLMASPKPVIVQQPQDCAVSPYGSAAFCALATDIPSPAYQWRLNGTPLPGQTAAILMLHDLQTNAGGYYSLIASNSGGTTQSTEAWLTVAATNPVPRVTMLPPTNGSAVRFMVQGEGGRWYRFETTDDLTYWWLREVYWYGRATNEISLFSVPLFNSQHQFVAASLDAATDGCVAQLRAFHSALNFYARDHKRVSFDSYTMQDLAPYFRGGTVPGCPANGAYSAGACVTNDVTCSIGYYATRGHHWP